MERTAKKSRKRDAIMRALAGTKSHPSAEWIYQSLKPEIPDLSLATVYRNLARFRDEGAAISVANVRGQERYDADTSAHAHFICDLCADVADVEADISPDRYLESAERLGARITGAELLLRGTCKKCLNSSETNNKKGELL